MIIVSYSELSKWDTCKRQWYYRFELGLRPIEEAIPMTTGTKGHKLLQTFYTAMREGLPQPDAHDKTEAQAIRMLSEEKLGDPSLLKAWIMVDNYVRSVNFTSEVVLIENRFLIPASTFTDDPELVDVNIGFTPDLVVKRSGDFHDVEDAKFVQRSWGDKKLKRYQQSKIYEILLKRMGYPISRSMIRFFNLETGKIYEHPYVLRPQEEETILRDFFTGVKEVVRYRRLSPEAKKLTRRTSNYMTCQFCSFEHPCNLEAEGKDASRTLQSLYVKSSYDYSS